MIGWKPIASPLFLFLKKVGRRVYTETKKILRYFLKCMKMGFGLEGIGRKIAEKEIRNEARDAEAQFLEMKRRMREEFVKITDVRLGAATGDVLRFLGEIIGGEEGEENPEKWQLAFRAAIDVYGEFPNAAGNMLDELGQEPAMIGAHALVDTVADSEWRPDVSKEVKEKLREIFLYAYAFGNMSAEIGRELDFDHPQEYFRTSAFLEFLGRFFNGAVRTGFLDRRGKNEELKRLFDAVIAENKGSYFLNARAKVLREQMEDGERPVGLDGDRGVFALAPGIEGKFENGALLERTVAFVSSGYGQVEALPPLRLADSPPPLGQGRRKRREGGEGFRLVSYGGFVGTEEERQKILFEYGALVAKPMRELVTRDLGVRITELSKEEQIFFLQFVKDIKVKDVERVCYFCRVFGRDGLRAFLSLEHGGEKMGEVVLAIPDRYGEADARKIFAKYGEIVGAARGAKEYVFEQFGEDRTREANVVEEALLRRGKNLLLQAHAPTLSARGLTSPPRAGGEGEGKESFLRDLETTRTEVLLLRAVIVEEGIAGNIEAMEKMRDMRRMELSGKELLADTELLKKVDAIYRGHYEDEKFPDGFADAILDRFYARLGEEGSRFFALLYKNEPQAFLLASKNGDACELSALNTNPEFEFTRAGLALVRCVMEEYLALGISIIADCPPYMTETYTRRFGFFVIGETMIGKQKLTILRREASGVGNEK